MPLENIPVDYAPYALYSLSVVCVCLFAYLVLKQYARSQKCSRVLSPEDAAFQKLQTLDFEEEDTKQLLYDFTLYAKQCQNRLDKQQLPEIFGVIEPLKYKNEQPKLDKQTIQKMKALIAHARTR